MPLSPVTLRELLNSGLPLATLEAVPAAAPEPLAGERVVAALRNAGRLAAVDTSLAELAAALGTIANPLQAATAFINAKYATLGGAGSFLGSSTSAVSMCPDRVGYYRHFQNGSIYWHPSSGAHEVHGAIRATWAALGWERGFLGYPVSDESVGGEAQAAGRFNRFQGGSVFWHPTLGAHEVHGAIHDKFLSLGAEGSFLGYPTTDETATPDGVGRFNHFQAGSIYWSPGAGANETHGLIRQAWAEHGWERNPALGYPITDELIPDRRIGHVHPETARNPRRVPADVIRFPLAAEGLLRVSRIDPGTQPAEAAPVAAADPIIAGAISANRAAVVNGTSPITGGPSRAADISTARAPASTAAGDRSRNRFGDFESGVLFWQRDTPAAVPLAAWRQSADGGQMFLSGAEMANRVGAFIGPALAGIPGVRVAGVSFAGITQYSFDGAGVHNRHHRVVVQLQGTQTISIPFGGFNVGGMAAVELEAEAAYDPMGHKVIGMVTNWRLLQGQIDGNPPLPRQLHQLLDPRLWVTFDLIPIDDTEAAHPIAVLSVKTLSDGDVVIFIEPADQPLRRPDMVIEGMATTVPATPVSPVPAHTTPVLVGPIILTPARFPAQPTIGSVVSAGDGTPLIVNR